MFGLSPVRADYSATINPQTSWGQWEGWGVSLCWWANVFGARDDLADIVFTTGYTTLNGASLPGLGMNIARYNAGGSSTNAINGSSMQVSPNIPAFKQIHGYWLNWFGGDPVSSSWNWTGDANQRSMLLKAKARGANLFELFSNSPMWWMCYNHNPSGSDDGSSDNLQSWNHQQHAVYLATIAKYAQNHWGIAFDSVEALNEPSSSWWKSNGTQEGCHFDAATQADVIGYLRGELDGRGLNSVNVSASDENTYDLAAATWNSFNSTLKTQVGRVNTHGYQYGGGRRDQLYTAVRGKRLWNSEYGESDASGMSLASNLNLDFRWLHNTAWCYWQAFDSGGWGLIQSNPGDNWIGPANPKYYVLAQYTRHIRPGMTIVDSGDGNTVAAYDPSARKLTLVTANYGTAEWITYNLVRFPYAAGPVKRWLTATGAGPKYQLYTDAVISQRAFRAWFPTNAIQTFEIQNVDPSAPATPAGLTATAGVRTVKLTWEPSVGATNYIVKRAPAGGDLYTEIADQNQAAYTDNTAAAGASYTYEIVAQNGAGESAPSPPVTAAPQSPPSLAAEIDPGKGQIRLSWPNWAQNYNLYGATNLAAPVQWALMTNAAQTNGAAFFLTLTLPGGGMRFFRLQGE